MGLIWRRAIVIAISLVIVFIFAYFCFYYISMRNVNEPPYQVISQSDSIQLRHYPPMLVAEVTVTGERKAAISDGFRLLADYIFGNNTKVDSNASAKITMTAPVLQQQSQKIAMTAPVLQTGKGGDRTWHVRFVMPASYTLATLPKPNNPKVTVYEQPAMDAVVIRFSGMMSPGNLKTHLDELTAFVKAKNIAVTGDPIYAFYNPPWTLPFMRRNEIMYRVVSASSD